MSTVPEFDYPSYAVIPHAPCCRRRVDRALTEQRPPLFARTHRLGGRWELEKRQKGGGVRCADRADRQQPGRCRRGVAALVCHHGQPTVTGNPHALSRLVGAYGASASWSRRQRRRRGRATAVAAAETDAAHSTGCWMWWGRRGTPASASRRVCATKPPPAAKLALHLHLHCWQCDVSAVHWMSSAVGSWRGGEGDQTRSQLVCCGASAWPVPPHGIHAGPTALKGRRR